jgi:hypothetical protein
LISSQSMGIANNPIVLLAAPKMSTKQLEALVAAARDGSEVVSEGRFPVIKTPYPAKWIGKGGSIAKSLANALGLRFLKVVEKN